MEQQSIASLYITVLFFMKISQLVYVPVMRAYNVTHTLMRACMLSLTHRHKHTDTQTQTDIDRHTDRHRHT